MKDHIYLLTLLNPLIIKLECKLLMNKI